MRFGNFRFVPSLIRILSGLDSLFTFTIRWYGSNLVSRQKVSRYTNTTNTSCRYTYKDLDCRHTNTLIAIMTSVSYAFRIKNGELYPVTKYTKFMISFLFLELLCVCNLYHIFMKYIYISYAHSACHHNFYIPKTSSLRIGSRYLYREEVFSTINIIHWLFMKLFFVAMFHK